MTNPPGPPLATTDPEEREFTVVIPAAWREHTQVIPVHEKTSGSVPSESTQRPVSRWSRFGAALFWIVLGWWLFVAVRAGTAVFDLAHVDGTLRNVPAQAVLDTVREATDRGPEELLTVGTLAVLASVVLLASHGRRWLGAVALLIAAGTLVTAVWHLAP